MNPILREPTQLFSRFQQDFNNLFRSFSEQPSLFLDEDTNVITSQWIPPANISETDDQFVISVDIPGVNAKDVEVTMDNGILSIKGERKVEKRDDRNGYHRTECTQGSFYRRFSLPDSANPEKIVAKDRDGVLTITLGKRQTSKPKLITIQS